MAAIADRSLRFLNCALIPAARSSGFMPPKRTAPTNQRIRLLWASFRRALAATRSAVRRRLIGRAVPAAFPGLDQRYAACAAGWEHELSIPVLGPAPPLSPVPQSSGSRTRSSPASPLPSLAASAPSSAAPATSVLPTRRNSAPPPLVAPSTTLPRSSPTPLPSPSADQPTLLPLPAPSPRIPPALLGSPSRSAIAATARFSNNSTAPCAPATYSARTAATLLLPPHLPLRAAPGRLIISAPQLLPPLPPPLPEPRYGRLESTRFLPTPRAARAT